MSLVGIRAKDRKGRSWVSALLGSGTGLQLTPLWQTMHPGASVLALKEETELIYLEGHSTLVVSDGLKYHADTFAT